MILFLDLDTRQFFDFSQRFLTRLALKRRDTDLIELQFLRDRTVQELPTGTTIRLGLKPSAAYTAEFLATGTFTKSGTGTSTKYLLDLNLNTVALNAAFAAATPEPETLAAMLEVEWASGSNISSSLTLPVTIANDVIRGNEGTPATLPLFYTASTSDFKATQAQAEAGNDNGVWMTPLRATQSMDVRPSSALPAPKIVFSRPQNLTILGATGNADGTFQLINAPFAIANDIPEWFISKMPVFLELVIFKRKRKNELPEFIPELGAFAPPPWYVNAGVQVWQHPWPQNHRTRAGRHTITTNNNTFNPLISFNRPNHLPVTSPHEKLPAWQTLQGRWRRRSVNYRQPNGTVAEVSLITPTVGRSSSLIESSLRAWAPLLAPLRCAWRFVAWHASSQSFLCGPLSPTVTIRPTAAPFFKTTTSGGAPAATVNAGWNGAHKCSLF